MKRWFGLHLVLLCVLGLAAAIVVADFDVSWHTINGGGGTSSGGTFEVSGTIGQHDAGAMSGGTFAVTGGFWAGVSVSGAVPEPTPCPGDANNDGFVDGFDLVELLSCWGPVSPSCEHVDLNSDTFVDGFDLVELLSAWGPCPR